MCVSPLIVPRKADGSSCSKLGPPDQTASRQRLPECRQATRVPHQHSGVVVFGRTGSRVRTRPLALFRSGGATILAQHFSAAIRAQTVRRRAIWSRFCMIPVEAVFWSCRATRLWRPHLRRASPVNEQGTQEVALLGPLKTAGVDAYCPVYPTGTVELFFATVALFDTMYCGTSVSVSDTWPFEYGSVVTLPYPSIFVTLPDVPALSTCSE